MKATPCFRFRFRSRLNAASVALSAGRSSVHSVRLSKRVRCLREDEDLPALEARLQAAVASEDYITAAKLRDDISERLQDLRVAVERSNRRFYSAFERADLDEMRSLWSRGDHVQCIHPLGGCIAGYSDVIQSWEAVFDTIPRGNFRIALEDVRIYVAARSMATVTCVELVTSGRDVGRVQATNVFECVSPEDGTQWNIIHHHGSPVKF